MKQTFEGALILLVLAVSLTNCRKKEWDAYYGRPVGLAQPIYQQLQAKGNFKNLLACIDKAGYKNILSASGYYTLFAPNDDAFQKFFTERNISGVAQIDSGTAQQIVTFSLVYNAFVKQRLSDYQSRTGWITNGAFRRRTANYRGFYTDTTLARQPVKAMSSNRNNTTGVNYFTLGDNNNKYTTYFIDAYMGAKGLSAADYNYFYPNSAFKGFNIGAASVVNADMVAENGYIQETDRVLLPYPTVDQYLASNPQFSEFKKLFDKYMVQFVLNNDATNRYKILTGLNDNVYIKTFNQGLAYSSNNENYLKLDDNDGQADGYTLFAPKNDVLLNYVNSVLLEHYRSLDQIPLQIIVDFLNAHMWQTCVWPSKFTNTNNVQGEPAKFNPATDIIDRQVLSNGFFYGTNKVQQANVFSTVYGKPYLDPGYLLMTRALDQNYRYIITVPTLKYTVIMMSDQLLRAKGFDYSTALSSWTYTAPGTTTTASSSTSRDMLQRILALHIIPASGNEMDDISGSGIIETVNGEYIKWKAGKLTAAGNADINAQVTTTGTKTAFNGRVYYADSLLMYSTVTIGNSIKKLGSAGSSPFNFFYQFLAGSSLFTASTGDILGVQLGAYYTVFIPNNTAIQAAVTAGLLPRKTDGTPDFNPAAQIERDKVNNFILYHILNKTTVVPDGKKSGVFESLYKKLSGEPGIFNIGSVTGSMQVTDNYGRKANVITANSNNLADRCVIHLIDNYLQYNPN
jgi:uncharacterized surface protein with fasciclin (FAS1) repeats